MKAITLTEEHKSKLLEMCNKLFPESNIEFTDDYYSEWSLFLIGENIDIHWFEFVMTHLSTKLFNKLNNFDHMLTADLEQECFEEWNSTLIDRTMFHIFNPNRTENWHPIDYLYEQFKLLK